MRQSKVFLSSIAAICIWAGNVHAAVLEVNEWSSRTQLGWDYSTPTVPSIDNSTNTPSGGGALKFTYFAGTHALSIGGGRTEYSRLTGFEVYVGHWMKWSPGFVWNPVGTKIDYFKPDRNQQRINALGGGTLRVQPNGNGLALDISNQQDPRTHTVYNNRGVSNFQTGRWYWFEWRMKLNSNLDCPDNGCDGIAEVWVDDVLVMQYFNLKFIDTPGSVWKYLQHSPEWGGSGGLIPEDQYFWVDHTVISTTRIGRPASTPSGDTTAPRSPTLNFAN